MVRPLKLASGFHLDFRVPEYGEPVSGKDVARTVGVRPEATTITYSHATFTVRQHLLAPLDEPALLVLLEVDAVRPLEIVASFARAAREMVPIAIVAGTAHRDAGGAPLSRPRVGEGEPRRAARVQPRPGVRPRGRRGASGEGGRPGFGWFFGGDAAINSLATAATGQWADAAKGLRFPGLLRLGEARLDVEMEQRPERLSLRLVPRGGPFSLDVIGPP